MAEKLLLLVNPCAGQRKAAKALSDLVRMFSDYGWDTTVYVTSGPGDGEEYLSRRAGEFDRIVCAGGDGTLNETFSGVLKCGADVPIGYLPCGTTNDYANSLGLSKDILEAGRDAMTGVPRQMDIGCINGRYFAYTASFGAFTRTAYNTPQYIKNVLGHLAYLLEGIKELPMIRPIHVKLHADGSVIEDDVIFGAVNNSLSVGGILKLDPQMVDMNDGQFEVLLVKTPQNVTQLNRLVMAVTQNDFSCDMFYFLKASRLQVECPEDICWTRDGEYEDGCQRMDIENITHAIRIIVPSEKTGEAAL